MPSPIADAQAYLLSSQEADAWLLYDYRGLNPILWEVLGPLAAGLNPAMVTRPLFLLVPARGEPVLLAHAVDAGHLRSIPLLVGVFASRQEMVERLRRALLGAARVAMEYSPAGALPRVSRVDAGTIELVRSLGVEVVSSADLLQYATQRWSPAQLVTHRSAAQKLGAIVQEAFRWTGQHLRERPTEHQVAELIRRLYQEQGLQSDAGPVVAANAHASDPHFEPTESTASPIGPGDWVLIDLWAKERGEDAMYADITWCAYVGSAAPPQHQEVFDAVLQARDAAVEALQKAHQEGRTLQGWEVDRLARDLIAQHGYGEQFTHRLGHSLGREVHANAVNLDDWETHDTRRVIPGIGFTVEPGIYLPQFGVRSEINLFMSDAGPVITSPLQRDVVLIG